MENKETPSSNTSHWSPAAKKAHAVLQFTETIGSSNRKSQDASRIKEKVQARLSSVKMQDKKSLEEQEQLKSRTKSITEKKSLTTTKFVMYHVQLNEDDKTSVAKSSTSHVPIPLPGGKDNVKEKKQKHIVFHESTNTPPDKQLLIVPSPTPSRGNSLEKVSSTDELPNIIIGPAEVTKAELLFPQFQVKLQRVHMAVLLLVTLIALLMAVVQYVFLALPHHLASKHVIEDIFISSPFPCWSSILMGFAIVLYELALLQYEKEKQWKKFAKGRWVVLLILDLYIMAAALYYFSEMVETSARVHKVMQQDWDELMKNKSWDGSGETTLEETQAYLQCCGLNSYTEWKNSKALFSRSFGNLCVDEQNQFGKNQEIVCNTPLSCWTFVEGEKDKSLRTIFKVGCRQVEEKLAHGVVGVFAGVKFIFSVLVIVMLGYHFLLVKSANQNGVELQPKRKFEECFH